MHSLPVCLSTTLLCVTAAAQFTPDVLQYQFNEVRGTTVANTASGTRYPATGTVNQAAWQSDPGRPQFRGNEAGYGCLGSRLTGTGSWVLVGGPVQQTGSFSVAFWMRRDPASTISNAFGYAFGDVTFRSFVAGAAGQGITFRGSSIGNVDSGFTVTGTPGVWQHVALVVDDAVGQAMWYSDGVLGNVVPFTPNTFTYTGSRGFAVAAQGDSGLSPFGAHYDMDDFRYYGRALTPIDLMVIMLDENAAAGPWADGCPGPGGVPQISANGIPQVGNVLFAVDLSNAESNRLTALVLGLAPGVFGGVDLSTVLGAGCRLEVDWFAPTFMMTVAGGASLPLPIPPNPAFSGTHVYGQWLVAGTTGAASPAIDLNVK